MASSIDNRPVFRGGPHVPRWLERDSGDGATPCEEGKGCKLSVPPNCVVAAIPIG